MFPQTEPQTPWRQKSKMFSLVPSTRAALQTLRTTPSEQTETKYRILLQLKVSLRRHTKNRLCVRWKDYRGIDHQKVNTVRIPVAKSMSSTKLSDILANAALLYMLYNGMYIVPRMILLEPRPIYHDTSTQAICEKRVTKCDIVLLIRYSTPLKFNLNYATAGPLLADRPFRPSCFRLQNNFPNHLEWHYHSH